MFGVSTFGLTATSYLTNQFRLPESPPCRPEGGSISTFQHQQLHWNSNFFTTSHPLWSLDVSCLIMSNKQLVRFVAWIEMWVNRRGCVCPPRHFNKARFVGPGSLKFNCEKWTHWNWAERSHNYLTGVPALFTALSDLVSWHCPVGSKRDWL